MNSPSREAAPQRGNSNRDYTELLPQREAAPQRGNSRDYI
jgi:hypothetical protein